MATAMVTLKTSAPDALMSGGKMLQHLGWRAGEPWLQEVTVPATLDWSLTGLGQTQAASGMGRAGRHARRGQPGEDLPASLILPQGHKGPAFLAYPNFNVYFEWNQSFTYVLTAAYFATRLAGAQIYDAGNPDTGLGADQMKQLQRKLQARGHDVGNIDGILGAGTRAAVQAEQQRLGLPADAWPTPALAYQTLKPFAAPVARVHPWKLKHAFRVFRRLDPARQSNPRGILPRAARSGNVTAFASATTATRFARADLTSRKSVAKAR